MAKSTKTKKTSSSSSSKSSSVWSLNKISMYTLVAVALLYVVSLILSCVDVQFVIVQAMQAVATAIMIVIVSILAWRYVRNKQMVWKVLYVLCLLLVIVGIIIPMVVR
jgi:uncharacterized membrane protein YfcA